MSDVTFRLAEKKDAVVIYELLLQMARDLEKEKLFAGSFKAIEGSGFSDPPAFEAIIAWRGDIALGLILYFYEFSTWRGASGIYVQDIFVDASARGLGLANRLTSAAVKRGSSERGATYMRLAVHNGNDSAFAFYEAMGFEVIDDETMLKLEGDSFNKHIM